MWCDCVCVVYAKLWLAWLSHNPPSLHHYESLSALCCCCCCCRHVKTVEPSACVCNACDVHNGDGDRHQCATFSRAARAVWMSFPSLFFLFHSPSLSSFFLFIPFYAPFHLLSFVPFFRLCTCTHTRYSGADTRKMCSQIHLTSHALILAIHSVLYSIKSLLSLSQSYTFGKGQTAN